MTNTLSGQAKMESICEQQADKSLVCDFKGEEWIVISDGPEFRYGREALCSLNSTSFFETKLENVKEEFRPWAEELLCLVFGSPSALCQTV